ncbi:peptidoglycan DD-metalloendopeptidase family protein [Parabacteroides sp. PF5-9]|uniref:murein hydrolase activator EnvC family protein n=1 Tax=Parabacteroides sp. PF5-9 TaxID=1742404 RepID=UPI002473652B|nr:peptidoglycan DD-metalloendopeptidase family protein [Parabacteroides sp. PF5-9]MDH6356877.1 septal ring factor EnvC (AmiA/AmiB activator) [Parabacteroides sp. PF5-9]
MRRFLWIVILILPTLIVFGQQSATLQQLEQQRKQALADIEMTNQMLQITAQTARNSLNRLNLLSQQLLARKKVINLLSQEINAIDKEIYQLQKDIGQLEKELKNKQENYKTSAQHIYKRRNSQDKLLFILSADNFSQSFRRMRYLREYADWQKKQSYDIIDKRKEILAKQQEIQQTRKEKQSLLNEREEENKKLQDEERNQKKEVQELDKKQKDLRAELNQKKKQADALNRQIESQIAKEIADAEAEAKAERERARRAAQKAAEEGKETPTAPREEERVADVTGGYAMTKAERQLAADFASNKGRLPFPLTGHYLIVAHFGEQQHQELRYVRTNNNGIDIQTTPGTDAQTVFNGVVTRVFVVPGYNNSVIIRHGNYLTVYSNLSQVYVKAGDQVKTRQSIGKIYTDTEDNNTTILHFQIWKERTKLNPEPWLD